MKQENGKLMKHLVILLILSSLLIGLGHWFQILCCDLDSILRFLEDFIIGRWGHGLLLLIALVIPFLFLIVMVLILFASLLLVKVAIVAGTILPAVLAVRAGLKIRRDDPHNLSQGKDFLKAALALNAIAAVCLLLMNLLIFFLDFVTVYPWGILSILLCLAGGTLLIFGISTYKKLQIPTPEDSNNIPDLWKNWKKPNKS